jgi:hypothetical protein
MLLRLFCRVIWRRLSVCLRSKEETEGQRRKKGEKVGRG